jgi:hypothetical protein
LAITITKKKIAASNKNQTHQEKPTQESVPDPKVPSPFIDKITIVVNFLEADATAVYNAVWTAIHDKGVFNDTGYKAKSGYNLAKWLHLESTVARALFQFKYENKKAIKCRFEFNPRKLGESGIDELRAIAVILMNGGWEYVVKHGRITRIDIAVDIPNTRPENYAILPQQGLTSQKWAVNGKLQTFVLGTKKGNQTILYNKKAKRLSQGKKWSGKAAVRIERRLRNPSPYKLSLLHKLLNPFLAAKLLKMPGPPAWEKKPWMWSLFTDSVSVRGLPAALKILPAERRTAYRKHLAQCAHELWTPDQIWAKWPACLAKYKLHEF